MTDTITTSGINAALAELQTQLPRITKDQTAKVKSERTGAQYSYTYADLAQVSAQVLPILGKLGLAFTSRPTVNDGKFVLVYELRHVSGEVIPGVYPLPERGTPQEIGSAITYARRYCLCAVTGVAPDDDDNDAVVAQKGAERRRDARSQPQQPAEQGKQPITGEQQSRLQKVFTELGVTDRADKLKYAVDVVKRQVSSATELTHFEAGRVIKQAERDLAQQRAAKPQAEAVGSPA
ncbi:ERF family protein [Micromonospora sp. NPDC000207]|uniref:ERF family protein n=1 Tax=Micromonospora sp. NPDC000207 TaxID=3154246 RepID=UPI0033210ED7